MNLALVSLAFLATAPQSAAELKLKLREDETVKFRSVLNVVTYSPDKIDERVANTLIAFTFAAEMDGKIPVKAVVEEFDDMDPASADAGAAMQLISLNFAIDKKGKSDDVKHTTSNPGLEPVGALLSKTLDGFNAIGFLGVTMPEASVSVGEKWTSKVSASDYLLPALAPVGEAFKVTGTYDVTFTLVDLINVNNKRHARIEVDVKGSSDIEINAPEFSAGGSLKLESASSVLLDLATGLVTRSKTDTSADLDLGVANAQLIITNLIYRV